ncbi:MAG: malonyl-ACP O-methyltransferase BioC [Candidatus Omnitrophica bacterium]|nr:malonyl-ACP O-methyltransferase BioC [Candidatus Omnitrophota bacterium]
MVVNKETIRKNFSRYAQHYDDYCTIQHLCAFRLVDELRADSFSDILDIGCGTGNYTSLLRKRFPKAMITALDISREMIDIARSKLGTDSIDFIMADAEEIDLRKSFDLISSNATFQWFDDMVESLAKYKKLLNEDGLISFSAFGPLTFFELNISLQELFKEETAISSLGFVEKETLEEGLKPLFSEVEVEEELYKERYGSLGELLKKIKYSGVRGGGLGRSGFWTQEKLNRLEDIYKNNFGEIIATHQVFFCRGVR